ncbi:MAG: hypothetical protein RLZZ324_679 [Candidatus Parcubacteria bacterium]|jgi:hypothetical protein
MEKMSKEQLVEIVKRVPQSSREGRWELTLDREENALFYSPAVIPDGTELFQVTDEYALYVDAAMRPQGVMVEYYDHNFIQHHPEFKIMSPKVFGAGNVVVPKNHGKNEDATVFKALFEKTLIAEAVAGHLPTNTQSLTK